MKIHIAEHYGLCFGVRDAIAQAERLAGEGPLTILGELVHNPVVRERLAAQGVQEASLAAPGQAATAQVMITAHGASDTARAAWRDAGFAVADGTCPLVRHAHTQLRLLVEMGCHPVVIGQRGHVEVQGLTGDFPTALVVEKESDLEHLPPAPRYGVVAQTTQPTEHVETLLRHLRARYPDREFLYRDTVCQPTKNRQRALRELIGTCDTLVIVGGRNSNNTRQLAATAEAAGRRVVHITRAEELEAAWFARAEQVGVTAGTSTLEKSRRRRSEPPGIVGLDRATGGVDPQQGGGRVNPETNPTTATATPAVDTLPLRQLGVIGLCVLLTTAAADFLLWDGHLGLSIGVFFAFTGLLLVCRHPQPGWRVWSLTLLLAATCVQSAIDRSLSNLVAAGTLVLALAGEAFHRQLPGLWPRVGEVLRSIITAPARWLGLVATSREAAATLRSVTPKVRLRLDLVLPVLLPTIALVVIFGWLFASGNAVFGDLLKRMDQAVWSFWKQLHLTPVRFVWWGFVATLALGLFYGQRAPEEPRCWTRIIPRLPRRETRIATWQTALALLAVNAVFGVANTLDAVYLWSNSALPAGVNPSEFLHQGVDNLMMAVLLSAVIIAGMFQQEDAVANRRWLKRLAHLWVLQNFVLIAGVLRRLQFYTHDYSLTEKRVYVGCFLGLVATGFLLLAWFVERRRSFNWLLGRNVLATWLLFFVLQFTDIAGFVARYNVARWREGQTLDVEHLANLGPTAWPQLIEVAQSNQQPEARRAQEMADFFATERITTDWRAFQWHEHHERRRLRDYLARKDTVK